MGEQVGGGPSGFGETQEEAGVMTQMREARAGLWPVREDLDPGGEGRGPVMFRGKMEIRTWIVPECGSSMGMMTWEGQATVGRLSGAQIWGDPELGSEHADRPVEWLGVADGGTGVAELRAGPGLGQGPSDPCSPAQPLPGATTSLLGLSLEATCRKGLAPGIRIGGAREKNTSLSAGWPGAWPCLERPGPQASREETALGHGVDLPCFFQHN